MPLTKPSPHGERFTPSRPTGWAAKTASLDLLLPWSDYGMHPMGDTYELRRVSLSDGRVVLVDADDPNTDEAIRAALQEEP
jgi:hypothetical protein